MEDMQALAITSLSAADVAKQYEHIRELGKGTYGKVDLVAHRTQGELVSGVDNTAEGLYPQNLNQVYCQVGCHVQRICLV